MPLRNPGYGPKLLPPPVLPVPVLVLTVPPLLLPRKPLSPLLLAVLLVKLLAKPAGRDGVFGKLDDATGAQCPE